MFSGEEILKWAGAPDVRSALEGVPERDALSEAAVGLRVGMIRDALATVYVGIMRLRRTTCGLQKPP